MKKILSGIVLVCVFSLLFLTGCGNKGLEGKWYYFDGSTTRDDIYYTFNSDKTGSYTFYGATQKFTYEDDGTKFTLTYENVTEPTAFEYTLDKETLTVKDSFGSDVIYKRK